MARQKDPAVRPLVLERAAAMLRDRRPITLRSLVEGTGVSSMAIYTYFDGMDGVWKALRQEGFTRLAAELDAVSLNADPVQHLTAQWAAYVQNAADNPDLYRVMFDANFAYEDASSARATLELLIGSVRRCKEAGRFDADSSAVRVGMQAWMACHGVASLVVNGPLSTHYFDNVPHLLTSVFVNAGDGPHRCASSVANGWVPPKSSNEDLKAAVPT